MARHPKAKITLPAPAPLRPGNPLVTLRAATIPDRRKAASANACRNKGRRPNDH